MSAGLIPTKPTTRIRLPFKKPSQVTQMPCMPLLLARRPCIEGISRDQSFLRRSRTCRIHFLTSRLAPQTAGTNTLMVPPMRSFKVVSSSCEADLFYFSRTSSWLTLQRLVNAFGFWQGQEIGNATATYLDDLMQAFTRIQQIAGSTDAIELWNGETGWPTTGLTRNFFSPCRTDVDRRYRLWISGCGHQQRQDFFSKRCMCCT